MGYSRRDGRDGLASSQGRLFSRSALLLLFLLGVQRSHSFSISSTFSELPSFRLGERTERRPLPASILYSIDDVSEVETEGKGKIVSRRSLTNTSPVWLLAGLAAATSGFAKPSLAAQDLSVYGSETKRDALGKARTRYEDFKMLPSGAQVKDVKTGQQGEKPQAGDRVVIDWEGYTIGYYGRIFEKKQGTIKGGAFYNDDSAAQPYFRFVVGDGSAIPALDEAIQGMRQGGVRQIVIPPELGYPPTDPNHDKVGPKPSTFSGMRALNFVLENQGLIDKTLLMNVKLLRVDKKGNFSFKKA